MRHGNKDVYNNAGAKVAPKDLNRQASKLSTLILRSGDRYNSYNDEIFYFLYIYGRDELVWAEISP